MIKFLSSILFGTVLANCAMADMLTDDTSGDAKNSSAEPIASTQQAITYPKFIAQCSAFGHDFAACDATCPFGFMATGGGCKTETVYWEISESYPSNTIEGWHCQGNEDFKSQVYNKTVTGYVVCVQF